MAFPASRINPYEIRNQKAKAGAYGLNKKVIGVERAATQMANAKFQRDLQTVNAGTRQMVNTVRGYSEAPDSQIWGGGQQQAGGAPPPSPSPAASPSPRQVGAAPGGRGTINGRPTGEVLEAGRARIAAANSPQPTPSSPAATTAPPPSPATPQQSPTSAGRQIGAVAATTARPGPMEAPSTDALIAASRAARISATRRGPLRNRVADPGSGAVAANSPSGPSPQRDRSGSGSRLPSGAVAANSPSDPSPQRDRSGSGSRLPSGAVAANSPISGSGVGAAAGRAVYETGQAVRTGAEAVRSAGYKTGQAVRTGAEAVRSAGYKTGQAVRTGAEAVRSAGYKTGQAVRTGAEKEARDFAAAAKPTPSPAPEEAPPSPTPDSEVLDYDAMVGDVLDADDTEMARGAPEEEAPPRLPIATVNPNATNPRSTKSSKGLREHFKAATRGDGIVKAGEKLKTGPYAGMTRQEARKKARLSFNGFATQ